PLSWSLVVCVCVCVLFNVCGSCARPKAGTRRSPERTIRRAERNCLPTYYCTSSWTVVWLYRLTPVPAIPDAHSPQPQQVLSTNTMACLPRENPKTLREKGKP